MPTCLSLFSGIGGLDHGLARAGFRHLAFCESDAYRRDVLRARWPGVPVYDDVARIGRERTDPQPHTPWQQQPFGVDLLAGGTPCQDLSVAGRRAGLAGDRSGLFFEYARVVDLVRPRWILWENVPGALSSQGGRDFGTVLGTLADIGYGVAWRVLDSRFFGVPQRRRRVFILGALADHNPRAAAERAGQVLAVGTRCPRHSATRGEKGEDVAVASLSGLGTGGPDDNDGQGGRLVANTLGTRVRHAHGDGETFIAAPLSHGSNPNSNAAGRRREDGENLVAYGASLGTAGDTQHGLTREASPPMTSRHGDPGYVMRGASVRRLTPSECEALQDLPRGWTQLGNTADSKRYAALGDAVTAAVAEWIGRRVIARER